MQLAVQIASAEPEEVAKLGAFLHDSEVTRVRQSHGGELHVSLQRLARETPLKSRLLGIIPSYRYRSIPADLTITDLVDVSDRRKRSSGECEPELMRTILLQPSEGRLQIITDLGRIDAATKPTSVLSIRDADLPVSDAHVTDLFRPVIPQELVDEVMRWSNLE